ncbi:glycosyltransferase, partial [Methyloglobulus sp.]|uniref:glycosyltransferase n=1 Tax=Methyloglobulus sp. TaxID=2518622 RepID=UPI0032B7C20D
TQVTINCLHSLAHCKLWDSNEAHVVIWENGTGSEAVALLQDCIKQNQWESWVELLVSPVNLGFTGGNNRVIERALQNDSPPDYFLLLNSDTLVAEQSLRSLMEFMDTHPRAGICGSQLLSESGEVQASPFRFPSFASELDNGLRLGLVSRLLSRWSVVMPTPQRPCAVDWVSGASMLLRRQMLEQIGLLDEGFFTYFEDVDLCKRAQLKGWQAWYVPESQVVHLEGASSGIVRRVIKRRPAYWFQARRRFYLKHYGGTHTAAIDAAFISGFALWRLRRMLQHRLDNDPPFMLLDFVRNSVFLKGFRIPIVQGSTMQQTEVKTDSARFDIMYVEGPGDVVESFRRWNSQEDVLTETSRTYSGQFFDFCKINNLKTYVISYHDQAKLEITPQFHVENLPKLVLGSGVLYHLSQILYGLRLVAIAIRLRPTYLDVTSGVTYWFVLSPAKLFGIKIISHLHNGFWPNGYRPTGLGKRVLLALDGWFFRRIAAMALCVSPEIQRQIEAIAGKSHAPIYQFRGQFYRKDFEHPPASLPHNQRPFNIVFAGRVERDKGVFDLLAMAEQLRNDGVTFEICGGGSALEELKQECTNRGLGDIISISGNLQRPQLLAAYARAHIVIVPTRSDCAEAFAKVAAEAILMGRPAICSSVVPAIEVLKNAVIAVTADDLDGYVNAIKQLLSNSKDYESLCQNCPSLREQFLDGAQGLTSVLQKNVLFNRNPMQNNSRSADV